MATFVVKNSGGVKKKPMIILKEVFFFVLILTRPCEQGNGIPGWNWILGIKCSNTMGVGLVY